MLPNIILACVLTALGGYLLGSILFGVLISKVMYNDDVRDHGSGNAGMTNVLRTYGKLPAVFTTIGDVGKSVAAVNLGRFIFDALLSGTGAAWQNPLDPVCGAYLAAIFCMIGHSRPIFFGFKGGKGVLVGAGAALATEPLVCAALLVIFLIEVAITRIVSLGSIIIAAGHPHQPDCPRCEPAYHSFQHDLLRDHGRYGHLAAPLQHRTPEKRYRVPLRRKEITL